MSTYVAAYGYRRDRDDYVVQCIGMHRLLPGETVKGVAQMLRDDLDGTNYVVTNVRTYDPNVVGDWRPTARDRAGIGF